MLLKRCAPDRAREEAPVSNGKCNMSPDWIALSPSMSPDSIAVDVLICSLHAPHLSNQTKVLIRTTMVWSQAITECAVSTDSTQSEEVKHSSSCNKHTGLSIVCKKTCTVYSSSFPVSTVLPKKSAFD
jgi:hypothetical protein